MGTKKIQRTYSDEFKAAALALVDVEGGSGHVKPVAVRLGIPHTTLNEWWRGRVTESVTRIRDIKKGEIAKMLEALARTAIGTLDDADRLKNAPVRDVSVTMGIAIDKLQLLTGEATERTERLSRGVYVNLRAEGVEDAVIIEDDGDAD